MSSDDSRFAPFAARMRAEGLPDVAIETFRHYYRQLVQGGTGLIAEDEIEPVTTLPDAEALGEALAETGRNALDHTVMIRLNGGLGTSMGLERAKTLLLVRDGLSFLDIIARQSLSNGVPLVLMNSFNTREESLAALSAYPELHRDIPLDFVQHKVPKVRQDDLTPAESEDDPDLAWCPPGHGDIYTALVTSGMLEKLLAHGYEYAFVANADNLGAGIDPRILGYFVAEEKPFMMEVADRTAADRKGGHLARLPGGQLILRESAQCAPEDEDAFQDITRHRFFNTNNLWLRLTALKETLEARDYILGLPMIRNEKTLDPRDSASTPVYQLETAMGSAIGVFAGAAALRVPRTRFAPVKTTDDLLAVRSDAFALTEDWRVVMNPGREGADLVVDLDPAYYKLIDDLQARFPHGAPSLVACRLLQVRGDICFGEGVRVSGSVRLDNQHSYQVSIPDHAEVTAEYEL